MSARPGVRSIAAVRHRVTYANVVSTLALFVALGGSAYAVTQIKGSQIKRRSIPANRVKKNALTGTEIKESKLARVPRAAKADSATKATSAVAALSAATATKLSGLAASDFLRSGRLEVRRASLEATTPQVVASWPEAGILVTTDGDADSDYTLKLSNTNSDATRKLDYVIAPGRDDDSDAIVPISAPVLIKSNIVLPQTGPNITGARTTDLEFTIGEAKAPFRTAWIHCMFDDAVNPAVATCLTIRSATS